MAQGKEIPKEIIKRPFTDTRYFKPPVPITQAKPPSIGLWQPPAPPAQPITAAGLGKTPPPPAGQTITGAALRKPPATITPPGFIPKPLPDVLNQQALQPVLTRLQTLGGLKPNPSFLDQVLLFVPITARMQTDRFLAARIMQTLNLPQSDWNPRFGFASTEAQERFNAAMLNYLNKNFSEYVTPGPTTGPPPATIAGTPSAV